MAGGVTLRPGACLLEGTLWAVSPAPSVTLLHHFERGLHVWLAGWLAASVMVLAKTFLHIFFMGIERNKPEFENHCVPRLQCSESTSPPKTLNLAVCRGEKHPNLKEREKSPQKANASSLDPPAGPSLESTYLESCAK